MPQSGIYQIVNAITQDYYVGSSVNIANRWTRHVTDLRGGKHINQRLQRAWDKYGEKSFVFSVLEEEVDAKNLIPREQWWIDTLTPTYNLRKIADRTGSPEPETIQKMRESREKAAIEGKRHGGPKPDPTKKRSRHHVKTEEEIQAMHDRRVAASTGRTMSPEAREKIRQGQLGRKASPETIEKLRTSHMGQTPAPEALEKNRQAQMGKSPSDETREKIRQSKKVYWANKRTQAAQAETIQQSLFD